MDEVANAMARYTNAGRALYMAHLHATRAGQPVSKSEKAKLQKEVQQASEHLLKVCSLEAVSESELLQALISE